MTPTVSRLLNGIPVITLAMPGIRTACVELAVDAGARHESAPENGLAHLFEHMVFKGTASRNARAIAEQIEDVGGALNAWTSRDMTMFHARTLADDLGLGLDIIADLVVNPRFDAEDLEREKAVVHSEIGEARDTPDDIVFDYLQAQAFPDQPLGRPVLGTEDSVSDTHAAALTGWRDRHYHGQSLALVATGEVDHAAVVDAAEAALGSLRSGAPRSETRGNWHGGAHGESRRIEQTHVTIGFSGPGGDSPHYQAALLFAAALGGGMSSRLFQELREDRGLAYSVSASHMAHSDTGVMSLYCAAKPGDSEDAARLAIDIARDCADTLSLAELDRARAQARAGLLMGLEGCAGQADWIARGWFTFGRIYPPEEALAELASITLDQVRAAGRAMLASRPAIAVIGPKGDRLAARLDARLAA